MLFAGLVTIPAALLTAAEPPYPLPEDNKTEWRVGVAEFSGANLKKENHHASTTLPLLLYEAISDFHIHRLGDEEKTAYRRRIRDELVRKRRLKLDQIITERDDTLFTEGPDKSYPWSPSEYPPKIKKAKQAVDFYQAMRIAEIPVLPSKEITVVQAGDTDLLFDPVQNPELTCRRQDLDYVFWGSVEQLDTYFFVEIFGYNKLLDRKALLLRDVAPREQFGELIDRALEEAASKLMGGKWGNLQVAASPPGSQIYVDGSFSGRGESLVRFLRPGEHQVTVRMEGYTSRSIREKVTADATNQVEVELDPVTREQIAVTSTPSNAEVYLDGMRLGTTPLFQRIDVGSGRLQIQKEGYKTQQRFFGDQLKSPSMEDNSFDIRLVPDVIDEEDLIRAQKDSFYRSFGAFLISLPVSIGLYGLYQNEYIGYIQAETAGDINELDKRRSGATVYYYAYWGSIFVNVSLFARTIVDLFHYIETSESYR